MAEAIGLVASIIAVVDLFVKVGVQCSIYCSGVKNAPRDIRQTLNEADRFTATLKELRQLLAGPNGARLSTSQNIRRSVEDCRSQLEDLTAKLDLGTRLQRITWPLRKGEIVGIIEKLQKHRAAIALDLQVEQTALLLNVHQEVVLAKLNAAKGAAFDSPSHVNSSKCHPGTRGDVLQQIMTWSTASDGQCIFWLNGGAGTGKSTISRTVAQSFADRGILGASFFFKRGEADRGNMALFFPTIASQLVQTFPQIAPHIRSAVEASPTIHDKSIKEQFDKLIADPVKEASGYSELPTIMVVADALDECDAIEHVRLVIHLLSQAKHFKSVRLKFFVTSRPELAIRLGFEDISGQYEDLILHRIPKVIIEHDIALFLKHELSVIRQDYNKSVSSSRQLPLSWPGKENFQKLVSMSVPLFIFAATACRFVQDRRIGGPKEQLAKILEHQTGHTSSLNATYLPIVDGLFSGLSDSEKRQVSKRFKQMVGPIVVLASPLCTPSLARLLGISPAAVEDQLDLLHSVLYIPSDQNIPVRPLHLSFRDFLVDPEKSKSPERYPFWVDEQETHHQLATRCLELLSTRDTLRRNICNLKVPSTPRSEINQQTIDEALPSEVQYACRYWVYHWKESICRIKDGELVDRFLTDHLLHWIEAMGLLGLTTDFIAMVHDLLDLLEPRYSTRISALLRDTRRIILSHRSIIDVSPLQIYYSAIVFAPEQSIVKTKFRSELPAWLALSSQVASEWDACLQTLEGHIAYVDSAVFSHDSKILASASNDGTIKLWDAITGTCISTLEGHEAYVTSVSFSHDSRVLASSSSDETIKFWDPITGTCISTFRGHNSPVTSVVFSHDSNLLASASDDCSIILWWNSATGISHSILEGHDSSISSVAFSHDSKVLASASYDKTIKVWDTATGACIMTLEGHSSPVFSVAFSHDSRTLASASQDCSIKLWNASTGVCIATLRGHSGGVNSVAFSHDSRLLASGSRDCEIRLWDVATNTCMGTYKGHTGLVEGIAFSHDSKLLASASTDYTIKIWDVEVDPGQIPSTRYENVIHSVNRVNNTNVIISTSLDKTIKVWDPSTGVCSATLKGCFDWANSIALSHDSKILASPAESNDGTIKLWEIATGTSIGTLDGHSTEQVWPTSGISAIAFSHNSRLLSSASVEGIIKVWDVGTGVCTATLKGPPSWVNWLAFLPHSNILISSAGDRSIKIWDIAKGICTATLEGQSEAYVSPIALSHDYKILASGLNGGAIKIWDTSTGVCKRALAGSDSISSVAFSHNSKLLASILRRYELAGLESILKFWDVTTGTCTVTIRINNLARNFFAFDLTGPSLYTSVGKFILEGMSPPQSKASTLLA
ncbi:WD40-repeat-containing domain protein [Trichoderma barbatum]